MGLRLTKLQVCLHLRSGRKLRLRAGKVTKRYEGNDLVGLSVEDSDGWPFYVRLDAIDAVTTRRVLHVWWD